MTKKVMVGTEEPAQQSSARETLSQVSDVTSVTPQKSGELS
jgi:hypothetical protein